MSFQATYLTEPLYEYLLKVSVRPDPLLAKMHRNTDQSFGVPMQASPEELNFIAWLIKLTGAKRILEVGCYTGISAAAMAQALPDDGQLITIDRSEDFTKLAREHWEMAGLSNKIELRINDAATELEQMQSDYLNHFDMIFIDANKSKTHAYYELSLPLTRAGGIIMVDDTLFHGKVLQTEGQQNMTKGVQNFNDNITADERVDITMLPIGDGLTLLRKRETIL